MTEQPHPLSTGSDVNLRAFAMPLVMIAALIGCIATFTKFGLAAAVVFWSVLMLAILLWSLAQHRRAKREIRNAVERSGSKVIAMNYRHVRLGPFSMLDTSRSQLVYRVVVRESSGRERIVWARWGRRWFWNSDRLELRSQA